MSFGTIFGITAVSAVLTTGTGVMPATRHNRLVRAEPGVESQVATSPAAIRLWFKEAPEPTVSSIALLRVAGSDSTPVPLAPAKAGREAGSLEAGVTRPLTSGHYAVRWRTAGRDGHVIRGEFGFTVK